MTLDLELVRRDEQGRSAGTIAVATCPRCGWTRCGESFSAISEAVEVHATLCTHRPGHEQRRTW